MLLFVLACSDYEVNKEGDGPAFDTSGEDPFQPDTQEDSDPVDTVDTSPPPECPNQAFPSEPLTLDDDCSTAPTVGSFTPVVEWSLDTFADEPGSDNVMSAPIVISLTDDDGDGDADQDDIPDIVFVTYSTTAYSGPGVLRAVSGDDGHALWTNTSANPGGCGGVAAADLDGDHFPEVIVSTLTGELAAVAADGTDLWTSDGYTNGGGSAGFAQPAIADMDGDGSPEIVAGSSVYSADGDKISAGGVAGGAGNYYTFTSFPVDLDGDGVMELIAGQTVYEMDGTERWTAGSGDWNPAVADFDLDGIPEIVATANGYVTLLTVDGDVIWETRVKSASTVGPPTIADYDGDGAPEIGVATNSAYTVIDSDGTELWQTPTTDASSGVTGSAVFDFEGDGIAEVVYADELTTWAFSGPDGTEKFSSTDHSNWTVVEYPPIADVDGDGEAEVVVPNGLNPMYSSALHGITVLGDADHSWRSGRKIWNQYAYHITNINDDGSVPVHADTNWSLYNNFRSGDITPVTGSDGVNYVARIDDVCADECGEGRLTVWVSIGNSGLAEVSGDTTMRIEVESPVGWAEVGTATFVGPVVSGSWTDAQAIELTGLPTGPITALRVTVDPDDKVSECHEDDNVAETRDALCP